jgi:serine/threonine protein kinase
VPEQQSAVAARWVGRVLAGHRIDALIGEGGMGVVYRATHLRLGRTVALKVLPPSLAADLDFRRRFEREAAIAASLEHPNVVPIYDAGHTDGILYLAMRFVDGEDLGAVLRREGRLGINGLCAVLGPVADALDTVHEAGLVHRDVKPGNVLLARATRPRGGGQVYLCDFGIAKGPAYAESDITSAGLFMGTPHYASPEQIEGRWLDGRSDQYGLACLVYRCLTGEVPYPRTEVAAVIYGHLAADPPRPSRLRPDLPAAVDAAVARAAAKHPDHRFPTCAAFINALRAAVPAPVPRPRPVPPPAVRPPARPPLPPTLPLPEPVVEPVQPAPAAEAVPAPVDVRAERGSEDRSVTISWTAGGPQEVEYKITRLTPEGRWHVVGRTRSTCIVDGAVTPDAEVPVYGVVARLGSEVSDLVRSPEPADPPPGGIPAVRHLNVTASGALAFDWPPGVTEAMVVVRQDRFPEAPDDPKATTWKITNMRYQLDGGLLVPTSVPRPCHVAVASCERVAGTLVVAPAFDPTARTTVSAR